MDIKPAVEKLHEIFGDRLIIGESLAEHNCFATGGKAAAFIEVFETTELAQAIRIVAETGIPAFMLGGGSNLLVADSGYEGLVIKNGIVGIRREKEAELIAGAGEDLQDLVDFATGSGLTGLEFAAGIYGTVGGAVYGNAGAYGSEIKDVLVSAQIVDHQGNTRTEPAAWFEFGYRSSKLKVTREYVTEVRLALKPGRTEVIAHKVDEILAQRNRKLPIKERTAGCFFKNIPDKKEKFGKLSAGKLLDEVGAKQLHVGGARVFEKHANILINNGTANSGEIRQLSKVLKNMVKEKFGIELQEEITLLGDFKEETV